VAHKAKNHRVDADLALTAKKELRSLIAISDQ
jgi:hypothetical protein